MENAAPIILINEFTPVAERFQDSLKILDLNRPDTNIYQLYVSEQEEDILEIFAVTSLFNLNDIVKERNAQLGKTLNKYLNSDYKRQVLALKEIVKPQRMSLPDYQYLQLRNIEVPLHRLEEYHTWREQTIFKYVKTQPGVESFVAYHSVISTNPGVLFLSGFSGDIEQYLSQFTKPEYQEIIKQAGDRFIRGTLNSKLYKKI